MQGRVYIAGRSYTFGNYERLRLRFSAARYVILVSIVEMRPHKADRCHNTSGPAPGYPFAAHSQKDNRLSARGTGDGLFATTWLAGVSIFQPVMEEQGSLNTVPCSLVLLEF